MPAEIYMCPNSPQCGECHYILEVVPRGKGLFTFMHSNNPDCPHSNKHFIVRLPMIEVLAESVAPVELHPTPPFTDNRVWGINRDSFPYDLTGYAGYRIGADNVGGTAAPTAAPLTFPPSPPFTWRQF